VEIGAMGMAPMGYWGSPGREVRCEEPGSIPNNSILLSANLLASALSRQGFFHSTLRAGLEVEGMALHFLNNVFRLNLALEPPQGTLDRLTFLQSNFCQIIASKLVPY
jgi:hypothetical protein